ncbi:MAG: AAA domain-containing protein [Prevotellaceae bacterium]|nr:AAA domain-containing protein [Prevotellaceae bacterium]
MDCTGRDYVRLRLSRWDAEKLYGRIAGGTNDEVAVSYNEEYLPEILYKGANLNLVRPSETDGGLQAELKIFEPDYLVDVSTVASCFAPYAESPLVSLISRLTPSAKTKHILLGRMAGQLLDEELHEDNLTYADSARLFFRHNAMDILGADLDEDFHNAAKEQRRNIQKALRERLPKMATNYNSRQAVVEPSFISEMLGLQGRMDFLQLDFSVLIEQKSGKAGFVPKAPPDAPPRPAEQHYAQMLLYMAILKYNFREQLEKNAHTPQSFLLYSRYLEPLLPMGFSKDLLLRALRLRNLMAAQDMRLAKEGFGPLCGLTAESLCTKEISPLLWEKYVKPQLEAVLLPIHNAERTERLYVLRQLRFVAREHLLSKLGNKQKEDYGLASLWQNTLQEKLDAGNIYDRLTLTGPKTSGGRVASVALKFSEEAACESSNFRAGDIAMLYPYKKGEEPDARKTIVFRGTISEITAEGLKIRLRNEQTDAYVFVRDIDKLWAVEHDFIESSYNSLYSGLHSFLTAPRKRRDLMMFRREPEVDESRQLRGEYGAFNEMVLRAKQARDFFLLIGPPGTGKTSFGLLYILREALLEEGSSVLLMAYTNRAVDEICGKLHGSVDFIRIGSSDGCAREYRGHLLEESIAGCANLRQLRSKIMSTRVFVGTVTAFNSAGQLFRTKPFALAIVDEASQILEPQLCALLSARHGEECAIGKFVFIGDHKQLPAVVRQSCEESEVTEPELIGIGLRNCRLSLFERLLSRYRNNERVTYMLTHQGRMHRDIADFSSLFFYGGKLKVIPLERQLLPSAEARIKFVDVRGKVLRESEKVNRAEAETIADISRKIYEAEGEDFNSSRSVGVIVPYRNQIATIRGAIDKLGLRGLRDISIDTVERFQGSQRRAIVYGFTVKSERGLRFLTDTAFEEDGVTIDRKLNVAMTRAEDFLILVGNSEILSLNPLFRRLIDFVRARGGYSSLGGR